MAGGDAVAFLRNAVRDLLVDFCARAHLRPQPEAPGLLAGQRCPADILVRGATGLIPALPDGSRPLGLGALALDVAIINALGATHWDDTLRGPACAVFSYARSKREHQQTASLCRQAGILYQPLVWGCPEW